MGNHLLEGLCPAPVIAEDLGISAKTVGHPVERLYRKAGARSRAAATLWAFEHDLVRAA
jgi:DNA-binding NarL/FixJ family response regulator